MKIDIKPQDKSVPEERTFLLHPSIAERLLAYAVSLESSVDYVLGEILNQVLPTEKPARQPKAKAAKESSRRAA